MSLAGRLRRARAAALDWGIAATDLAGAVWRRLRPGPPALGDGEPDCREVPVVVLPGILEPWTYLAPMGNWLAGRGHPVHYVETLGWNLSDIERSARRCLAVLGDRGLEGAVVVGHSKGGLVGKAVLALLEREREQAAAPPAAVGMVTVATPFGGSTLGGRLQRLPGLGRSPLGMFLPGSAQLTSLAAEQRVNERIVSLAPAWDQVIPEGSHLDGATNVTLDVPGHFRPVRDERVWRTIHEHVHLLARPGQRPGV